MYLLVSPNGSKGWRLKYLFEGKEYRISLGVYPMIGLADARVRRDELKKQIAYGINPSEARKDKKVLQKLEKDKIDNSFENIAQEYVVIRAAKLVEGTHKRMRQRLENYVYPVIGLKEINEVTIQEILSIIRKIESVGKNETAHRVLNLISQVYKYGLSVGKASHNVAADIDSRYALEPTKSRNFPTLTEATIVEKLLCAIDEYGGHISVKTALQLAPYVALRPGNIREAEWNEFDLIKKEWKIPASKMKMRSAHIIPLTDTMIDIIERSQNLKITL